MKFVKKIMLLTLIFILSFTLDVYADGNKVGEITLTPSATEVKVGDTITITILASCDTGIGGIDSTLDWDKSKLEFANQGDFQLSGVDTSTNTFKFSVLYDGDDKQAEVAVLEFKVKDTATVGDKLLIKFSTLEIVDNDFDSIIVADKEIELTVVDGENNGNGGEEQIPDDDEQPQQPQEPEQPQQPEQPEQPQQPENPESGNQQLKEDNTTADKVINYAGARNYVFAIMCVIAVIAIILYKKVLKYRNII